MANLSRFTACNCLQLGWWLDWPTFLSCSCEYDIIIFVNNQLDALFFFKYVYFYSLHVSGSHVPIIRRINCINTTSGICHLYRWPSGGQVWIYSNLPTRRSSTQSDIYQMSYWYNWFSWWWTHGCPKRVQNRNKHTWKRIVHQVGYLQRLYRDARSTKHKKT